MKTKVCGIICVLAFLWLLGTAGNSDCGVITPYEETVNIVASLVVLWVAGKYGEIIT